MSIPVQAAPAPAPKEPKSPVTAQQTELPGSLKETPPSGSPKPWLPHQGGRAENSPVQMQLTKQGQLYRERCGLVTP